MAKFRITRAQTTHWDYNANHPQFSQRTAIDDDEMHYLLYVKGMDIDLSKWWRTQDMRWYRIETLDFSHLENIVNYFSQDGMTLDPMRQGAFDNVMIEYLKRKLDNDAMLKKAINLMEEER